MDHVLSPFSRPARACSHGGSKFQRDILEVCMPLGAKAQDWHISTIGQSQITKPAQIQKEVKQRALDGRCHKVALERGMVTRKGIIAPIFHSTPTYWTLCTRRELDGCVVPLSDFSSFSLPWTLSYEL